MSNKGDRRKEREKEVKAREKKVDAILQQIEGAVRKSVSENHPEPRQSGEISQNPRATGAPQPPDRASNTTLSEGGGTPSPKISSLWKSILSLFSLLLAVLGIFGFEALWPRVVVDASMATDPSFIADQFTFNNQTCYPVKVISISLVPITLKCSGPQGHFTTDGVSYVTKYNDLFISGRDSVTVSIERGMMFGRLGNLSDDSKVIVRVSYKLPYFSITKTDSALFGVAHDVSGNAFWVKKPIGEYANFTNRESFTFAPPGDQY